MTLGIYAKVIASKTDHGAALDGLIGRRLGTEKALDTDSAPAPAPDLPPPNDETPHDERVPGERLMGFEPTTFCMASRRSSQLSYSRMRRRV